GIRLSAALWNFWQVRGYLSEGRAHLAEALARQHPAARTETRARALKGAGKLAWAQGDYMQAKALHEECLAIYTELRDKRGIASWLNNRWLVAHDTGEYAAAKAFHEQSLKVEREIGRTRGVAGSLEEFARLGTVTGQSVYAVRQFGAVHAPRKAIGAPVPP